MDLHVGSEVKRDSWHVEHSATGDGSIFPIGLFKATACARGQRSE